MDKCNATKCVSEQDNRNEILTKDENKDGVEGLKLPVRFPKRSLIAPKLMCSESFPERGTPPDKPKNITPTFPSGDRRIRKRCVSFSLIIAEEIDDVVGTAEDSISEGEHDEEDVDSEDTDMGDEIHQTLSKSHLKI